jgi:ATP-binding cassette subfamily B (MDR/TAP) protein 10
MRIRERLFKSLMMQEMAFFDRNKTGELINRLSADTEIVGTSVSQNLSDGLRSIVQLSGGVGMMLYVSPTLGAIGSLNFFIEVLSYSYIFCRIGLSSIPAVTLFAIFFGRYIKRLSKKVQDVLAEATDVRAD